MGVVKSLVAACVLLCPLFASAAEPIGGPQSFFYGSSLRYYPIPECNPECPDAIFRCDPPFGVPAVKVYAFTRAEIIAAFTTVGRPRRSPEIGLEIVMDGEPYLLTIISAGMIDSSGMWLIDALDLRGDGRDWVARFGSARSVAIRLGDVRTLDLSRASDDRANRAAFAEACLARRA